MRSFRNDRSGNVLVIFGLSLPIVFAASGAAFDYSDLTRKRSELQKLADETALASTKALATSTAGSPSQRENEAREMAERLLKEGAPGATRTITPSAADSRVRIDLAHEHPLRFGAFVGARSNSLAIQSEATYRVPASACIVALGQTEDAGISLVGSAKITAPQCGVWSDAPGPNSITTQGAARIVARTVCGVGSTRASSSPPAKAVVRRSPIPTSLALSVAARARRRLARPITAAGTAGRAIPAEAARDPARARAPTAANATTRT